MRSARRDHPELVPAPGDWRRGDAITRNASVTASESHRFLAKVPAPSRRVLHFGKCACERQLVPSRTSAGLGEQKANQAVGNLYLHGHRRVSASRRQTKPFAGPLGSLVISLRHCQTSVMAIPRKSPVPRKGPRSTPPGQVGACISENARATATRTFTDIGGSRRAEGKPSRSRRRQETPAAELGSDPGRAGTGRSRIGFRLRQHCAGERRSVCGHFSRTGSADRSTTVRPCPPATAFDFPSRLGRGRAHASTEGKCWRGTLRFLQYTKDRHHCRVPRQTNIPDLIVH